MNAYADTSFLVSLYTPDVHSATAAACMSQADSVFLLTPLGEVELTNAFELRLFRREISRAEARQASLAFQNDVRAGVFAWNPIPAACYEKAKQLARRHAATLGVRTLDILHVALALVLRADVFCTFDANQRKLVKAAGLPLA